MEAAGKSGFDLVRQHRRMLANMECFLERSERRILDFGCGAGEAVYQYRDAGFDAYGFDIRPAPELRSPEDAEYFRFDLTGKPVNVPEFEVPASFRVPFDDDYFDFVFSTSTFEHILEHELALAETSRVLRRGGVAVHTFPARYCLIEPHMKIPFGGVMQNWPWLLLWSLLGIRNSLQSELGVFARAAQNRHYAKHGINYVRLSRLLKMSTRHFSHVSLQPRLWELGADAYTNIRGNLLFTPLLHPLAEWLYSRCFTVVLVLRK